MLNSSEIYYLNRALDGSDIYGIDRMKSLSMETTRDISPEISLIEKKYLTSDKKITNIGFIMIKRLEDYKKANSYIWIDDKIVSYNNTSELVTLRCNENNEFDLSRLLKAKIVAGIFKDNPFLFGNSEVETVSKIVDINTMTEALQYMDKKDFLSLRKEKNNDICFYNLYLSYDGELLKYDVTKQLLSVINPKDARKEILNLFCIKGENES